MKKLVLAVVAMFVMSTMVMADNDKPVQVNQLPAKAQTFLNTYFKDVKVALATQDTELFSKSYDVVFNTGDKVEFDKSGEWTEVRCRQTGVPAAIVPAQIAEYVKTTYPDAQILQIERDDRGGYEVKLSNRWEITFNKQMQVVDIDD